MKKVFYERTTTDGIRYLHCISGDDTGDVEIIRIPEDKPMRTYKPFCPREDCGLTEKEENRFYKKALKTTLK